jgi:DNA-binding transcriptional regulator YhcF (GntR family)
MKIEMLLRGKKIKRSNPDESFTKIPNKLIRSSLSPTEKLILITMYSYSDTYVLAYTRLAKSLNIAKNTFYKYWNSLVEKGIISETETHFVIDISSLKDKKTSKKSSKNEPSEVQKLTYEGSKIELSEVQKLTL